MKVSRRLSLAAIVGRILFGTVAQPASAADFSLMTGGRVTSIEDDNNIIAGLNITVGLDFTAFYDFNDTTPNTSSIAHLGAADYRYQNSSYGFSPFALGSMTIASPNAGGHFLIHMLNNHNGWDAYTLLEDEAQVTGGNFTDSQLYFNFIDTTQSVFDSLDIPTDASIPAPQNFDQRYGHIYLENASGGAFVRFAATTLQPVPAPSAIWGFVSMIPMMGILLRRKRNPDAL